LLFPQPISSIPLWNSLDVYLPFPEFLSLPFPRTLFTISFALVLLRCPSDCALLSLHALSMPGRGIGRPRFCALRVVPHLLRNLRKLRLFFKEHIAVPLDSRDFSSCPVSMPRTFGERNPPPLMLCSLSLIHLLHVSDLSFLLPFPAMPNSPSRNSLLTIPCHARSAFGFFFIPPTPPALCRRPDFSSLPSYVRFPKFPPKL